MSANNSQIVEKYIWTRPTVPVHAEDLLVVKTVAGIRSVLEDQNAFLPEYSERLKAVTGYRDVDWAFVSRLLLQDIDKWATYFGLETSVLIEERSIDHIGMRRRSVDIVRDVINVLPVRWICTHIAGLPLKEDPEDEQRQCAMFADVCHYIFLNPEPSKDWRLREISVQTFRHFQDVVKAHLGSRLRILDAHRASLAKSLPFLRRIYSGKPDLTALVPSLFFEVVPTARQWSQVIAHVVNFYLDDSRKYAQKEIVRLAELQTREGNKQVVAYIHTALGGFLCCFFQSHLLAHISHYSCRSSGKFSNIQLPLLDCS